VRAAATDVLSSDQQGALMVLGDLNDEVDAATTQILNGPPVSEIRTADFNRLDRGVPNGCGTSRPGIPVVQRFSRIYRGRKELIEHGDIHRVIRLASGRTIARQVTSASDNSTLLCTPPRPACNS
jgi:hypothetical protein